MVNIECLLGAKFLWLQARIQILVYLHNERLRPLALSASTKGRGKSPNGGLLIVCILIDAKCYYQVSSFVQRFYYIRNAWRFAECGSTLSQSLTLPYEIKQAKVIETLSPNLKLIIIVLFRPRIVA